MCFLAGQNFSQRPSINYTDIQIGNFHRDQQELKAKFQTTYTHLSNSEKPTLADI